jgi:hypothetical protein
VKDQENPARKFAAKPRLQRGPISRYSTSWKKTISLYLEKYPLVGNVFSKACIRGYSVWIRMYTAVHTASALPERNSFIYREILA